MFFQRIETPGIAHFAYILGGGGAAALIDPARDVERYLGILRRNGLTLRYVLETHRQEDFEMGGAALRGITGAEIAACDHELMPHADKRLKDGETFCPRRRHSPAARFHVPGHTPESMCYAVTLDEAPDAVWACLHAGDAAQTMGDTGRTEPHRCRDDRRVMRAKLYDGRHAKHLPHSAIMMRMVRARASAGRFRPAAAISHDRESPRTLGIERQSESRRTIVTLHRWPSLSPLWHLPCEPQTLG